MVMVFLLKTANSLLMKFGARLPYEYRKWLAINHPEEKMRRYFFSTIGVDVGEGTFLTSGLTIAERGDEPGKTIIKIGKRVAMAGTIITCSSPNRSNLNNNPYVKEHLIKEGMVTIEDDAWIGYGAIIFPGVTIGREAIVGAGAVVTKDVPPRTIVAGVPARVIRKI